MSPGDGSRLDRRTMLRLLGTGSALALAGCGGDGDDGGDGSDTTPTDSDTVPEQYRTAIALGGQERDPTSLSTKDAVNYQTEPSEGQQCSGCLFYIEDRNGDGMGACAVVEGTIDPEGYCVSYSPYQEAEQASLSAVEVPADARCAVCDMKAANFPEWNAQAVHGDGTREFFCSSGCATTYYAVPETFAETDATVSGLWVTEYGSGETIDGTTAHYALETDSDRVDDPMRLNPAPFASREDAVAYIDEVDYLSEDDVVELSAFDRDLASQYRGRFLE